VVFKCTESAGIVQPITADQTGAVYNLYGVKVDDNYRGIVIINGKKVIKR
jgi:alkyl hydroperoxide reductase subunit AhpC